MRELLVQIATQPLELLWFAQLLGRNGFVVSRDEAAIVRSPRLVLTMSARTPRLGRGLRVTHLGVVRHLCGERLGRLSRGIGCVLASNVALIEAGLRGRALRPPPPFSRVFPPAVCFPPP